MNTFAQIFRDRLPTYAALSGMPPRSHWPGKPAPWRADESEVYEFILGHFDGDFDDARRILGAGRHYGVVRFDPKTGRWGGTGRLKHLARTARRLGIHFDDSSAHAPPRAPLAGQPQAM